MKYKKYHRTYHLPWSNVHSDDKIKEDLSCFEGEEVVVLEKLDGENTTIYNDGYLHARSIDSRHNFTRDWVKKMASILRFDIPEGWRFVFENVNFYHSIEYNDLEGFAYLLSIWNEKNERIAFDDMLEFAELLDLPVPKILYRGVFNKEKLIQLSKEIDLKKMEGYVVLKTKKISENEIGDSIAKFVRPDHCQPNKEGVVEHWLNNTKPNQLSETKRIKPFYMGG